jgi:glycine cleavage system aminomethyltransferase T
MGWVPPELAREGAQIQIRVEGTLQPASVRTGPFFDPSGNHLKA